MLPDGDRSAKAFETVAARSTEIAERARRIRSTIAADADDLLAPLLRAQRSDLVAESNQIEGYDVTREHVLHAVATHRELVDGDIHTLVQAMRADPKIVNALGLYKAQELADEWAHNGERVHAFEMRQLHALLTADDRFGGKYRTHDVAIGGVAFRPPAHYDVPHSMDTFAAWWRGSTGDPVLDATIAHAWLTHIHPYEDGNGRLARVLANFALAQAHYPPLIVRAGQDRGEYYAALAASDEGNILPLYQLFAQIIRRTVRAMGRPNYTQDYLEDRLLSSLDDQHSAWVAVVKMFEDALSRALERYGWTVEPQGISTRPSFKLLSDRSPDGNGWFAVVRNEVGLRRYLLWFGYASDTLCDLFGGKAPGYPSVFISEKDTSPDAMHPYIWAHSVPGLPDEVFLKPLEVSPVTIRTGAQTELWDVDRGATRVAAALVTRG